MSASEIRSGLQLARGAIVMLYACFAAGTSSLDTTAISSTEAQRRVAEYSDPFRDVGILANYSNWSGMPSECSSVISLQGRRWRRLTKPISISMQVRWNDMFTPITRPQAMWLDKNC